MNTDCADAVNRLEEEVDSACSRVLGVLSHEEIAKELERIAQGWRDSA